MTYEENMAREPGRCRHCGQHRKDNLQFRVIALVLSVALPVVFMLGMAFGAHLVTTP